MARRAIAEEARRVGITVTPWLAVLYALVALLYIVAAPVQPAGALAITMAVCAALMGLGWYTLNRVAVSLVHLVLTAIALVGVVGACMFVELTGAPEQSVVVIVAIIGSACVVLSVWSTAVLAVFATAIWLFAARDMDAATRGHWLINLITSSVLGMVITWARVRMVRRLEAQRAEAVRAREVETRLLANVTDELRTPIAGAMGVVELFDDAELSAEHAEYLDMLRTSHSQLLATVDTMLEFARSEAGAAEDSQQPAQVRAEIDAIGREFEADAEARGLELKLRVDEPVPASVRSDWRRTRKVLELLVDNAIKYTSRGSVEVIARRGEDQRLRFEVRDTGDGVPVEAVDTIFEPFRRGDESHARPQKGIGLGLALARSLVDIMDGRIGVDTKAGDGSCFWFEVPAE